MKIIITSLLAGMVLGILFIEMLCIFPFLLAIKFLFDKDLSRQWMINWAAIALDKLGFKTE